MSVAFSVRIAKDEMLGIRSKISGPKTSSIVQHAIKNETGKSTALFARNFGLPNQLSTNIKIIKKNSLSVDFVRCGFILNATEC